MIPGSGSSTGEGIGYPLQYSWASLVVQLVKNPPAMWETWVLFLGQQDPLEYGNGNPLQYSCLENRKEDHKESDTAEPLLLSPTNTDTWV